MPDEEAEKVRRLFDDRPDDELVYPADGHPGTDALRELDLCDTLGTLRRWYRNLVAEGSSTVALRTAADAWLLRHRLLLHPGGFERFGGSR